jgi:signal transduction histidine kinase
VTFADAPSAAPADNHIVQFYEGREYLAEMVTQWVRGGIDQRRAVVVIARREHREAIRERLTTVVRDVRGLIDSAQLTMLDAQETLRQLMVGSLPDADRFRAVVGGVIAQSLARSGGAAVRAYGEMVDVLLEEGNPAAALRLEELWTAYGQVAPLELLCGYSMHGFRGPSQARIFDEVCQAHTLVLPTEHYQQIDDVHRRLREIATLQQRSQALEEAIRVRDEFMSVAGHELRTPLTALRLQVHAIADGARALTDPKLVERSMKAGKQIERLAKLIDQLLDVSRIESGQISLQREPMDLGLTVREVCERHADGAAHAGCQLRVLCEEPLAGSWDKLRVEQVVLNLVANAIKYGAEMPVDIVARNAGDRAVLTVRDHGIGIAADDRERIFERFERAVAGRRYGGLGLGLWIARQAVEAHGGTIRVESRPGEGSTFTVELPFGP